MCELACIKCNSFRNLPRIFVKIYPTTLSKGLWWKLLLPGWQAKARVNWSKSTQAYCALIAILEKSNTHFQYLFMQFTHWLSSQTLLHTFRMTAYYKGSLFCHNTKEDKKIYFAFNSYLIYLKLGWGHHYALPGMAQFIMEEKHLLVVVASASDLLSEK